MDEQFQQRYQAAERAYGAEHYAEARQIAAELLDQLGGTPTDPEQQAAVLGWRAVVALLLGHVELYGLSNPAEASDFFEMVLDSQPHDTLEELAQQGLKRAAETAPSTTAATATDFTEPGSPQTMPEVLDDTPRTAPMPEILRDPFRTDQPVNSKSPPPSASPITSATPWLHSKEEAEPPMATTAPEPSSPAVQNAGPRPSPQSEAHEPDPMELLNGKLLRVKLPARSTNAKAGESLAESPGSSWLQRLLQRR